MSIDSVGTAKPAAPLPDWYPGWARNLAELYFSGTICTFVLYGNVHDLVGRPTVAGPAGPASTGAGPVSTAVAGTGAVASGEFVSLADFLATSVFGSWDVVLGYDLGRGLRGLAGADAKRLQSMMQYVSAVWGPPANWSRDPDKVLDQIDQLLQRNLLVDEPANRRRMAFVFEHAQYLLPPGDLATMARGQAARLVRMISWAANPYIKRLNLAFCLITEKLSELSDRLVNNPHVAALEIPLPSLEERRQFIMATAPAPASELVPATVAVSATATLGPAMSAAPGAPTAAGTGTDRGTATSNTALSNQTAATPAESAPLPPPGGMSREGLALTSSGLSLVNLNVVLAQRTPQGVDLAQFRRLKKSMIERHCQGLVEFVEPPHTLDLIVGLPEAKTRLRQDAEWISQGKLETAPMGYLFCGSVGTGKTFLAECYAGSIGIPCVKLRNFRSKYVGETEGNLEQVLTVLRSLGPVVVIIDEADASLGDRRADGDSGTSGRVFSMIASQMGDTRYRGRIIWMLLTCRPDLLPIDLKRQGRCEVHIPLFAPQSVDEIRSMFLSMAKKNKVRLADGAIPDVSVERQLSGADLESVLLTARRKALAEGQEQVSRQDLQGALDEFIPSAEGLEKELQELAAVLECTERNFLPEKWRGRVAAAEERTRLQERLVAIRQLIGE